jgi:Xaa-Pro aminopeptidase
METTNPDWEMVAIFGKINQFYFTGTMQEGMLLIPRYDDAILWVRRSYERAIAESLFPEIKPMDSYRDAAGHYPVFPKTIHLETEVVPIAMLERFQKYFPFKHTKAADTQIALVRSLKSKYELTLMEESGRIHQRVLEERVPEILREGISEAAFGSDLYSILIEEGHHGVARFGMFDTEIVLGHIAFGESSIYPTSFNGPGGNYGMSAAVPVMGSRSRTLRKGDLVFVDVACGVDGYHTDKTVTYMFGEAIPEKAIREHHACVQIQNEMAAMLVPGAIPSQIYQTIMDRLSPDFLENFMGFGNRQVRFLGHGIGLTIDEMPVIAKGFDEPIQEGMVFALEPKKGIPDVGMVGIENTFEVTPNGGRCITGDNPGLIKVF